MNYLERTIKNALFIFSKTEPTSEAIEKMNNGIMRNLVSEGIARKDIDTMTDAITARAAKLKTKGLEKTKEIIDITEEEIKAFVKEQKIPQLDISTIVREVLEGEAKKEIEPVKKQETPKIQEPTSSAKEAKTPVKAQAIKTKKETESKQEPAKEKPTAQTAPLDATAMQQEIMKKIQEQLAKSFASSDQLNSEFYKMQEETLKQNAEAMKKLQETLASNPQGIVQNIKQVQATQPTEKTISLGDTKYIVTTQKTPTGWEYTYKDAKVGINTLERKEVDGYIDTYSIQMTQNGVLLKKYVFCKDTRNNQYALYLINNANDYFRIRLFDPGFKEENTDVIVARVIWEYEWFKTNILKNLTPEKYDEYETGIFKYTKQAFEKAKNTVILANHLNRFMVFRFTPYPTYNSYWLNAIFDYQNATYSIINTLDSLTAFIKKNKAAFGKELVCEENMPILRDLVEMTSVNQFSDLITSKDELIKKANIREEDIPDVMANLSEIKEEIREPNINKKTLTLHFINRKYEGELVRIDLSDSKDGPRIVSSIILKRVFAARFTNVTFPAPEEELGYIR